MPTDEYEVLQADLRKIIGKDYLYIQAKDKYRHFDPITAAITFAGAIFVAFITGAATKAGERVGKEIADRISVLLTQADPPATTDKKVQMAAQINKIRIADQSLDLLGGSLAEDYLKKFIEAGKRSVEQRLIADRFPESKAKRISSAYAKVIEGRIKNAATP